MLRSIPCKPAPITPLSQFALSCHPEIFKNLSLAIQAISVFQTHKDMFWQGCMFKSK